MKSDAGGLGGIVLSMGHSVASVKFFVFHFSNCSMLTQYVVCYIGQAESVAALIILKVKFR